MLTNPPTTEKQTAAKHCNGIDYWIINHAFNSNRFNAYKLTSDGINPMPVISNVGSIESNDSMNLNGERGYMKISPNGKKLALAMCGGNKQGLEIYDFNNFTGEVSNPIIIEYPTLSIGVYSLSFSPDNSKLYASYNGENNSIQAIMQFNLNTSSQATMISSAVAVGWAVDPADLEIAPDGKIYFVYNSLFSSNAIGVINNPNNLGTSCNVQLNAVPFVSGTWSNYALPNFIDANIVSAKYATRDTTLCSLSQNYTFSTNINSFSYQWSTGDSTFYTTIDSSGAYWVTTISQTGCLTDTFNITLIKPPPINVLKDTIECGNFFVPINVNATYPNTISYSWSDGFSTPLHTIIDTGNYWVQYNLNNTCVTRDSFSVFLKSYPIVNLGQDTTFCIGDLTLNAYNTDSKYIWNTGENTSSIVATKPGIYWVQINNKGCISYDTLIIQPEYKMFDFIMPNIITPNNDNINDEINFSKYQFSNLQLEIYDRWGKKVFESEDPTCIWKPTCDDGTYFHTIQYKLDCGNVIQSKTLKGFITIIR